MNNGSLLSSCVPCEVNSYAEAPTRSTRCVACPEGSFTALPGAVAASDCRCRPVGWFRASDGVCTRCDPNDASAVCVEWIQGEQVLASGWWLPSDDALDTNTSQVAVPARCYETAGGVSPCLGGDRAGTCVAGHQGFLCSECSNGYYRLSNTCRECPVYAAVVVGFMVPAVLCGLIAILMCLPLTEKTRFSKFALAVNLFQFVSMAGGEKIQWPQILLDVYESMSFWNLNIELVSPDCLSPMTVQRRLLIFEIVPVLLVAGCWLCVAASRLWFACWHGSAATDAQKWLKTARTQSIQRWDSIRSGGSGSGGAETHTRNNPIGQAGVELQAKPSRLQLTLRNASRTRSTSTERTAEAASPHRGRAASSHRSGGSSGRSTSSGSDEEEEEEERSARTPKQRVSAVYRAHLVMRPGHWVHSMVNKGWRATIIVAFISYMAVSRELFAAVPCAEVAGRRLLIVDMRVDCDSSEYTRIISLVIVGVIVYPVGVLLGFVAVVWSVRGKLQDPTSRRTLGVLFATYKPQLFFWELISLFKRLLLVLLNGLVPLSLLPFKFAGFVLILSMYIGLLGVFRPYTDRLTNNISIWFNQAQFLTAFGGVIFMLTADATDSPTRVTVTVLILCVFVGVVAVLVTATYWRVQQLLASRKLDAQQRRDAEADKRLRKQRSARAVPRLSVAVTRSHRSTADLLPRVESWRAPSTSPSVLPLPPRGTSQRPASHASIASRDSGSTATRVQRARSIRRAPPPPPIVPTLPPQQHSS